MNKYIELTALIVGYSVLISGGLAAALWLIWYFIGKVLKLSGHWPLFYKTMMRIAYERDTKKK